VIPWDDASTQVLLNPRLPTADAERVRALVARVSPLAAHVWVTTSGATGRLKPVALSKRAILASAAAVNAHLASDARDVWLNALPAFHVGGLGVHARAHLSGAQVVNLDGWDPWAFSAQLTAHAVTLTSLVPTQMRDLVRAGLRAPEALRAIVVGGGALDPALRAEARALGWPVLPSYGATECASQIATADLASLGHEGEPPLRLLPHVEARTDPDGRIEIRSHALLTGYATETGLEDPKRDGWWRTDDRGAVRDGAVVVVGRVDETVKVGGELVALGPLQLLLEQVREELGIVGDAALVAMPDARLGWAGGGPPSRGLRRPGAPVRAHPRGTVRPDHPADRAGESSPARARGSDTAVGGGRGQ
jgi:O-succinylbenzoic acid--CoA ligase